ncbi:MbcA/ParS/Xre antitoxin family protein [Hyphomonas sp.]|uniref:MbcA/ParS/Xre antitoxin family protein n=1 Tax=Hyphomonas sp. TaxID=87 RepID=UPI0035637DCD
MERASYLLGIYRALQILFADEAQSDQWLHAPNDNPLFGGAAPIEKMLDGFVVDLAVVREHLDSQLS